MAIVLGMTALLPSFYPDAPPAMFRDVFTTLSSLFTCVITTMVILSSQQRTLRRQRDSVEKAKNIAEELAQLRAQFLAAMSHEVRTPLNGIVGLTNVLMDGPLLPGQKELLEVCPRHAFPLRCSFHVHVVRDLTFCVAQGVRSSSRVLLSLALRSLDFAALSNETVVLQQAPFSLCSSVEQTLQAVTGSAIEQGV